MPVALVLIEKPALATYPVLTSTNQGDADNSYLDALTSSRFIIKLIAYQYEAHVKMEETTGDGDDGPTFDYVPWVYLTPLIDGLMVASQPTGIGDLSTQTITNEVRLKVGQFRTLTLPGAVISNINIQATRRGLFNRVTMTIRSTNQISDTNFEVT